MNKEQRTRTESKELFGKQGVNVSLRDKLEDFVALYWYENEYRYIDKKDHAKATESRKKFRKWFNENIDKFLKNENREQESETL